MKIARMAFVFLATAFFGCTATYEAKAVKKARDYVIEKMPELSEKARHNVKYNPPRLMQKLVLAREVGTESGSKKDIVQTCVVWPNPDQQNTYIVVAGVSERRLDDWHPIRLLIKSGDDWEINEPVKEAGKTK